MTTEKPASERIELPKHSGYDSPELELLVKIFGISCHHEPSGSVYKECAELVKRYAEAAMQAPAAEAQRLRELLGGLTAALANIQATFKSTLDFYAPLQNNSQKQPETLATQTQLTPVRDGGEV